MCPPFRSLKSIPRDVLESRLLEAVFGLSPFSPDPDLSSQSVAVCRKYAVRSKDNRVPFSSGYHDAATTARRLGCNFPAQNILRSPFGRTARADTYRLLHA